MIIKGKVLAQDGNDYNTVVYESNGLNMATILPNWNITVETGKEYFFMLAETLAGETFYLDEFGNKVYHKYTNTYIYKAVEACNKQSLTKESIENMTIPILP